MENETPALPPEIPPAPRKTWIDRIQAFFEVFLLSGVVSSLLALMPFMIRGVSRNVLLSNVSMTASYLILESCITLLLLFLVMHVHGETLHWLGFSWSDWRVNMLIGFAILPALFILNAILSVILQRYFPKYFLERNPLAEIVHTPRDLAVFIVAAIIAGGFKEELQRAFILRRFQVYLGGAWLGLVLWSAAFGLGHSLQGIQGVIGASLFGLIFGAVYLIRGNLIGPIVAHAIYDTLALLEFWLITHNDRL